MIIFAQAGQAGKTRLLFEMHRLRKRVFHDRLKWPVHITSQGLEVDQFDLPDAVYLLALNNELQVIGSWRMLPSTGPTMIRDVWPHYLETLPLPSRADVWEMSRFAVDHPDGMGEAELSQINIATAEMFCALTELCIHCGIKEVHTLYDMRIARILRRINCVPSDVSLRSEIDGIQAQTGRFVTDQHMLDRLRRATGISSSLLDYDDIPPVLEDLRVALPKMSVNQVAEKISSEFVNLV